MSPGSPFTLGSQGQMWRSRVTKTVIAWVFALLWVLAYSGLSCGVQAYLAAEYLVNGRRFFERAFVDDLLPHLFHEQHESVERFLDVDLPLSRPAGCCHSWRRRWRWRWPGAADSDRAVPSVAKPPARKTYTDKFGWRCSVDSQVANLSGNLVLKSLAFLVLYNLTSYDWTSCNDRALNQAWFFLVNSELFPKIEDPFISVSVKKTFHNLYAIISAIDFQLQGVFRSLEGRTNHPLLKFRYHGSLMSLH